MPHLLTLEDLGVETIERLVDRAVAFAGGEHAGPRPLAGKIVGIYFRTTSTRTRSAFSTAALRLGAGLVAYGPDDLQLATGETIQDTARVLSGYLDALVIRTNQSLEEMRELARQDEMAIVNALSEDQHPTQALADLSTIKEAFGRLAGVHVLYLGEGNSTARALLHGIAQIPDMRLTLVTPEGYGLPPAVLERAAEHAARSGARCAQHHDLDRLPEAVEVVYTSRWQTMGVVKGGDPHWRHRFLPYAVTPALMAAVSKRDTVFLHDLPAMRGEDVADEVLDGPQSLAWRQARHKMWSAMAVLEWCLSDA